MVALLGFTLDTIGRYLEGDSKESFAGYVGYSFTSRASSSASAPMNIINHTTTPTSTARHLPFF